MPVSFLVVAVNLSVRLYCTENDRGRLHIEDRQHFIAVVVDDFYGDLAGFGRVEGAADGRVEGGPGRFVDFGPQGPLELVVGFVGAGAQSAASTPAAVVLVSGSRRSPGPGRDADRHQLVPVRPADPGCRSSARRPPRRGCDVAEFHQPRVSPATRQNGGSWALFPGRLFGRFLEEATHGQAAPYAICFFRSGDGDGQASAYLAINIRRASASGTEFAAGPAGRRTCDLQACDRSCPFADRPTV